MRRIYLLLLAATALVACADDRVGTAPAPAAEGAAQAEADEATAPTTDAAVPAAQAPTAGASAAPVPPPPAGGAPTPAPYGDLNLARFDGYGDVPFGTPVADMARLWGGELKVIGRDLNDRCYFLTPIWAKQPADFNFMVSEDRLVRFSTDSDKFVAPGGAHVGLTKAEVMRRYAGRVDVQPHKYSDGQYLRVKDPGGGKGVLVMETDGTGNDARVTEWRVGLPPEVDYVEGCS